MQKQDLTIRNIYSKNLIVRLLFVFILLASTLTPSILISNQTEALNGSQFNPGRIIDDSVFFNSNTMSAPQIQNFLNSKVPRCDTNHKKSSSSNDSGPPYICLKDYRQNTSNIAPDSGLCSGYTGANNESAATIIYKVARSCGINPQVLLVMLQKEQSLITDTWPWKIQYDKAMGAFCPDTAPCDPQYKGFFYQVYYGAHRFKVYQANPNSFNYKAGRNNTIYYHPGPCRSRDSNGTCTSYYGITHCKSSSVYIENVATALLYIYTPYQPNKAALNNLYGTGDSCSSYGNRNFWRMFNDWFGTTEGTPFFQIANKIYITGADSTYYYVPNPTVLRDYGYGVTVKKVNIVPSDYVSNMTYAGVLPSVARFEGAGIFIVNQAKRYPFPSRAMYENYGYTMGEEAKLPSWAESYLTLSPNVQPILRLADNPTIYSIENGKARPFCDWKAFTTLGSPIYSTRDSVIISNSYLNTLTLGPPIITTGSLIRALDADYYGIWNGSQLQPINPSTAKETGKLSCVTTSNSISQMPKMANVLGKFAKNSNGDLYILDNGKKLSIKSDQLLNLGLAELDFLLTSNVFLASLSTNPMTNLFRVNGGAAVSLVNSGNRYGIPSRDDLYGLGYDFGDVTNVNVSTANLFKSRGLAYKPGRLVRIGSQSAVFLINKPFEKLYIPSRSIMSEYGYSMNDVSSVSSSSIQDYPTIGNLGPIVKVNTNDYWIISLMKKHRLPTNLLSSTNYNINSDNTTTLESSVLASIPKSKDLTNLVRVKGTAPVYLVVNGQKRPFVSRQAFESRGYDWSDVTDLSSRFINSFPNGAALN